MSTAMTTENGPTSAEQNPAPARPEEQILLPGQSPSGEYILAVLVKRTYEIRPGEPGRRVPEAAKLVKGDVFYGDPKITPVKFESDLVPFKLATDVVLNGKAYAPEGRPVRELYPSLTVGAHRKEILVIGDRTARFRPDGPPVFTEPLPFAEMDITYDRAYGGVDIYSDPAMALPYGRNPLGRGFVVKNKKGSVDGRPLPNVEDPQDRLTPERLIVGDILHWERQPMPQGFGWFSKYWYPRGPLAGVMPADKRYEEELRKAYEPLVPPEQRELYQQTKLPDMDFRFFNGASPGLAVPYLSGDEVVFLSHLTPEGDLSFRLPGERPQMVLDIGFGPAELAVVLHTLMIRVADRQFDLVWRGSTTYPGPDWLPEMKKLVIQIT